MIECRLTATPGNHTYSLQFLFCSYLCLFRRVE